jgi:hypothetical protein
MGCGVPVRAPLCGLATLRDQRHVEVRCMNPERGVDDLLGNGVLGHRGFSFGFSPSPKDAKSAMTTSGLVDSSGRPDRWSW